MKSRQLIEKTCKEYSLPMIELEYRRFAQRTGGEWELYVIYKNDKHCFLGTAREIVSDIKSLFNNTEVTEDNTSVNSLYDTHCLNNFQCIMRELIYYGHNYAREAKLKWNREYDCSFLRDFSTVRISAGARSGKTQAIFEFAEACDLVIVPDKYYFSNLPKEKINGESVLCKNVVSLEDIDTSFKPSYLVENTPRFIFIDDASWSDLDIDLKYGPNTKDNLYDLFLKDQKFKAGSTTIPLFVLVG